MNEVKIFTYRYVFFVVSHGHYPMLQTCFFQIVTLPYGLPNIAPKPL